MRVEKDFEDFIKLLNEHEVRYLIVGAFAVSFHSRPRFTGDLDVYLDHYPENIETLLLALNDFGFESIGLSVKDFQEDNIIQLGYEPNRINLLTGISGVAFGDAFHSRVKGNYGDETAWFISLDDLIKNKKASDRLKDKSDLELLEQYRQ
ncbi:MAG: DUF6036 family nucleotidyltransferase [Balneolaceae bacterium]|nr:DUF6036 family nucleotidyltransferase [Balneolaceae bacterium]